MDEKEKELEVLEKEQRKLIKLRMGAESRVKATSEYQRLEKTVGRLRKKGDVLRKERNKLWKKTKKKFINIDELPYPDYSRNANAFYGGDTNILPKTLRAIEKFVSLSKLKALQIEGIVNHLIMKEEQRTPKLVKVLAGIAETDKMQSLAWDKQDELVWGVDLFSGRITVLGVRINRLEEEIKYPGKMEAIKEKEDARKLAFASIDKIYETLTKKKRR